ncbi:uncharacterized protein EURHEDRAFT_403476 [Aspergillus ruber CBS 135680]|uniref:Uncharacterized protein n=1 Tax=Aspergillus ruber (strain CBS 135680) TaxID=1388766 RepID=A0A017SE66_ASPRC|nr:uncharacterized protein EURHEDRAFT_546510 [Aspergillus ruber CBS 135680]XP_040638213.1 uncharacterized protein EURHEDRAFT_403476 [Aspergillus ruber CBS 135680]EYE91456.1 hypothetical protein EURHEDRAFT_546510 [Aspergillus ruber CBS 135680]EYE94525.1 hypothetical protein EURHEDRAFT_403476 [Aspergillus ruber CBS 135680]
MRKQQQKYVTHYLKFVTEEGCKPAGYQIKPGCPAPDIVIIKDFLRSYVCTALYRRARHSTATHTWCEKPQSKHWHHQSDSQWSTLSLGAVPVRFWDRSGSTELAQSSLEHNRLSCELG